MNNSDDLPNHDAPSSDQPFDRSAATCPDVPDTDASIDDTFDEPEPAWLLGQAHPAICQSNEAVPVESPRGFLENPAVDESPLDPGIDSDIFGPHDAWSPSIDRMVRRVSQF